jgi:hypothetical protein
MSEKANELIDTQVLSIAFQQGASGPSLPSKIIASPTAKELLLAQSLNSEKPLYYVLHPAIYDHLAEAGEITEFEHYGNAKWARGGNRRTDDISFYLGNNYPTYREYGDQALAILINEKKERTFKLSISHLPKYRQKYLMERWKYLVKNDFTCLPLNDQTVNTGLSMFSQFLEKHSPKASVANTVLDMMIFATAFENRLKLHTRDKLLASFASEYAGAPVTGEGDEIVVDFTTEEVKHRRESTDSKGYVNRGWSYAIRNQKNVSGR